MLGYQCDDNGYLLYSFTLQLDVLLTQANCGTEHYIVPMNATMQCPPPEVEFKIAKLVNGVWTYEDDFRGCLIYNGEDSMMVKTTGSIPNGWSLDYDMQIKLKKERAIVKADIKSKMDNLTVSVDGHIFDANPNSLMMMMIAIQAHEYRFLNTIEGWVMADNTYVKDLPLAALKNALSKGGLAITELYKALEFNRGS